MSRRGRETSSLGWLAWTLWSATTLLVATAVVLPANLSAPTGDGDWGFFLLLLIQSVTFATVGLILARARPDNAVSWLFLFVGLMVAVYMVAERYQYLALVVRPGLPFGEFTAWLQAWTYVPALGVIVTMLPQLFPTGRPISRRWYPALVFGALASFGLLLVDALAPGQLSQSSVPNPYAISPAAYHVLGGVALPLYASGALVAFASLVVRWRRADRRQRQQLKWFAYVSFLIPVFVFSNVLVESIDVDETFAEAFTYVAAVVPFLGLPVAVAVSILRHQLYDIDLVIKRTVVYGVLTALLVGTYLGSVLLFRLVLGPVTGPSDLAVAASTLAVAALFRPLRSRVQATVDRRFYRRRYDAARTVEGFASRLRHELDLETLGTDLRGVVSETMQPTQVSLWLRRSP